jgi:K+-transporting ATPase ATPase A chain
VSNFVEIVLMLLIPAAFTATFGTMAGRRRQGWALYVAMVVMFIGGTAVMIAAEAHGTPAQRAASLRTQAFHGSTGGNMEGKEQRFGIAGSALFVSAGTASGDGAVNSAVESYTGLDPMEDDSPGRRRPDLGRILRGFDWPEMGSG